MELKNGSWAGPRGGRRWILFGLAVAVVARAERSNRPELIIATAFSSPRSGAAGLLTMFHAYRF